MKSAAVNCGEDDDQKDLRKKGYLARKRKSDVEEASSCLSRHLFASSARLTLP